MNTQITDAINTILKTEYGLEGIVHTVEHPADMSHGDYASNVALVVSKTLGVAPRVIAETIAQKLEQVSLPVTSITVAGPGFINITLSRDIFVSTIESVLEQSENWGKNTTHTGAHILVEHSSPNLFKPFHIGHLMNNTIGESITRLARSSGAHVTTLSFPSDISLGVAKAIFVLLETYGEDFEPTDVSVLGDAYVEGVRRFDEDESVQPRVKAIADALYLGTDSPEVRLFNRCKLFNIAYFEQIVALLGTNIDAYIYESEAGVTGKKLVEKHTDVFAKSDGAIVYTPDESKKLHTAVFINSQNNPTYEAKDLGLLSLKFDRYHPDLSIFVTDAQQVSHFGVVLDAAAQIEPAWAEKSLHRYHGRMSFKGAKMSSRLGGVPLAETVLHEVVTEVEQKNSDISKEAAHLIGIAALKMVILRTMAGKDLNFDPDTSLSFEGDSGPYLQYTAVRARSVLQKTTITPSIGTSVVGSEVLERLIARFPEVVSHAQVSWAPHYVVGYLLELAQAFNSWYGNTKIIDTDEQATSYRLAVTKALYQTIENGLWMLGISVPEKM